MAAIDTFDWFVRAFYPTPDESTRKHLEDERKHVLSIRNENERLRYIRDLVKEARDHHRAALS